MSNKQVKKLRKNLKLSGLDTKANRRKIKKVYDLLPSPEKRSVIARVMAENSRGAKEVAQVSGGEKI